MRLPRVYFHPDYARDVLILGLVFTLLFLFYRSDMFLDFIIWLMY